MNQEKIVRSNIATFNSDNFSEDYDEILLAVLNGINVKSNYSGKVSLFNLYKELSLFNSFENGKLNSVGFTRRQGLKKNEERSNSCADWYLVTYYANGNVTKEYVFTTCDNGCQFYRIGRTNCGGGGGAGGGNSGAEFPVNPSDDTTYEYTDKNGQYTKYKFNATTQTWEIIEVILPEAVVEAKSDEYLFLDIDWPGAYHGQTVFGTDNIIYTFGNDGKWHGAYCIQNQLTTPCLKNTTDKVLNPNLASTYNQLIQEIFNTNDKVNLIIQEGIVTNGLGSTSLAISNGEIINVMITLNPSAFQNVSQEFIASTVMHECFHAIINYLSNNNYSSDTQHIALFTKYLNLVAGGLQSAFPSMQLSDARGLILKGALALEQNGTWSPGFVNAILDNSNYSRSQVETIREKYKNLISGIPCN